MDEKELIRQARRCVKELIKWGRESGYQKGVFAYSLIPLFVYLMSDAMNAEEMIADITMQIEHVHPQYRTKSEPTSLSHNEQLVQELLNT